MVRLIDADKMLKRIESWNTSDAMDKALYNFTLNRIIEQPTVDVEPVRHGKWFIGTVPYFVCSECKNRTPLRWDERCGYVLDYRSPYCPNCGAKMDAERKEK